MKKEIPSPHTLNRMMERFLGRDAYNNSFCDDFVHPDSRDLEEKKARTSQRNYSKKPGKLIAYIIDNFETEEERIINPKDHKILYDKNCAGCVIYNKETGEQRIVTQKEFEQAYFKWKIKKNLT